MRMYVYYKFFQKKISNAIENISRSFVYAER